jgi:UDP-glucuronate 4-epimerase
MKVLVTGAAGFIGMHVCRRLLARGDEVLGLDNLNAYYEPRLKRDRLRQLPDKRFSFVEQDICDRAAMDQLFAAEGLDRVVHLAAQAGVRHSLTHPHDYVDSNVTGFLNVLEGCRRHEVGHLTYASSSSVYGGNTQVPFRECDGVDHPLSLYAATKKANELMAHVYSHLYALPTTGLRFFTVYGPWGRPDMAPFLFTRAILEGRPIDVFNHGQMLRDFTYVDDIAEGVVRSLDRAPGADPLIDLEQTGPGGSRGPFRVFNIGNQAPVLLTDFISAVEQATGRVAVKRLLPLQPGDMTVTSADVQALQAWTGFTPQTPLAQGVDRFVAWYRGYFGV